MSGTARARMHPAVPYFLAILAGIALAYVVVAVLIFPSTPSGQLVAVPNVVGSSFEDAAALLRKAGFVPEQGRVESGKSMTPGAVVRQDPEAGTRHPPGMKVTLHTSGSTR